MTSFQFDLKKRFNNRCVLSNVITIEANHIIPKFVCALIGLDHLIVDSYNGLLMTDSLHREFDRYYWALDIHNIVWSNDESIDGSGNKSRSGWVSLPILIKPQTSANLMINLFQHKSIRVPIQSLAFLWIHYQIFLTYNFTKFNHSAHLWIKYRDLINSPQFVNIQNNPLIIDSIRSNVFTPSHIISSRNFKNELLVIDRFRPLTEMTWLSFEQVDPLLIEEYLDQQDFKSDPDWIPSSYIKRKINKTKYVYPRRYSLRISSQNLIK
jgi:hypothetical protein